MLKMYKVCVYGFIYLGLIGVSITHITTPKNDWVPISEDEVLDRLNRLNRRNVDVSHFHQIKTEGDINKKDIKKSTIQNIFDDSMNENINKNNAMNLVQHVKVIKLNQANSFYPVAPDTITSVNDLQSFLDENQEQTELRKKEALASKDFIKLVNSYKTEEHNIDTSFRKPKAIEVNQYTNNIKDSDVFSLAKLEKEKEQIDKKSSPVKGEVNRKIYQVTEDEEELQSDTEERTGYFYTPPQPKHGKMENNLTKVFIDILSKHNIGPDDNLQNYVLSRRQQKLNPANGYMLIPIPITVFSQFNSLKSDLLAVLLSNYGYYLPGSYGIRGKYRNLYGYLASNNIHNNKPFGSYKIFSDTDSSN